MSFEDLRTCKDQYALEEVMYVFYFAGSGVRNAKVAPKSPQGMLSFDSLPCGLIPYDPEMYPYLNMIRLIRASCFRSRQMENH